MKSNPSKWLRGSHEQPPRLASFLVWLSAPEELREDILVNFIDAYKLTVLMFGLQWAQVWAHWQGFRSLMLHGLADAILRVADIAIRVFGGS
jgi:hypothetical protein